MALTAKQQRFCEEYLIDLNATQAAIRAGYSEKTAMEQGYQLLQKTSVQGSIQECQKKLSEKTELTTEWVLNRFRDISNRCVQAVPVMVFDKELKCMVQATTENDQGEEVGIWTFDSSGANKATEMIAK